mgnify:CR=1 FL=1
MVFWRIYNNNLYAVNRVDVLGWSESNAMYIPHEYLEKQDFVISRSCLGIGDWGVISAMPRLLKEKYPNCRVRIPSESLLKHLFAPYSQEWVKSWENPYKTMEYVFANNPYVDGYANSVEGEIFHDHYQIYNENNPKIPLLEQMLKFWQFSPEEYEDSSPELYFSEEEKIQGDSVIKENFKGEFGTLLISNRYNENKDKEFIQKALKKYSKLPYFYWVKDNKYLADFNVNLVKNLSDIPIRIQMYIKTQAEVIIGNMSGADIMFPRYTKVYMAERDNFGSNIVKGNLIINKANI